MKMISRNFRFKECLPKIFLILALGITYLATIAPGLTWANNGADGGDFITAAATWGVAHPPGYPVYLLIARLFQLLPVGSIAYRTNLLSALCTILAAAILYDVVVNSFVSLRQSWLVGLVTAFAFGLSPLVWSQAVITEVYALQALLIVLILYFLPIQNNRIPLGQKSIDSLLGLIFGLAIGNHLTTILLLPPLLIIGIVKKGLLTKGSIKEEKIKHKWTHDWYIQWVPLIRRCIWIFVGISFYITLFIRANAGSPVNWGNPSTIKNFIWLITGEIYGKNLFDFPFGFFPIKLQTWGSIIMGQVGILGSILAIFGLISNWSKLITYSLVTCWMMMSFCVFSFIYNSIDSFVYLIFAMISISLWLGWGVARIISWANLYKPWLGVVTGYIIFGYLISYGLQTLPKVDASRDHRAEQFGNKVMSTAPIDSIIYTDGDKDSFALWYFHFVLQKRPDISIIVVSLLPYDWYRDTLHKIYPTLSIPDVVTNSWKIGITEANPHHPICNTIVVQDGIISCDK